MSPDEALIARITRQVMGELAASRQVQGPCSAPPACACTASSAGTHPAFETPETAGDTKTAPSGALAWLIDHTLLKADVDQASLTRACDDARRLGFAGVCVSPDNIGFVARRLKGSGVKAIAVVAFPSGGGTPRAKANEAKEVIRRGADEVDMVIDVGALKAKDYARVYEEIAAVVAAAAPGARAGVPVKVILETGALTDEEKIIGCALAKAAGATFVKTSTGFGPVGATAADVALMRRVVGPEMGVKASGGIRSLGDAQKMVAAGANRIGTSAGVAIVTGVQDSDGGY